MDDPKKKDPEKKPEDPKLNDDGTPKVKDGGNPSDGVVKEEDFKALQKKLSEKDLDLRKAILALDEIKDKGDEDKTEFSKIVTTFNEKIDGLASEVKTLNDEKTGNHYRQNILIWLPSC